MKEFNLICAVALNGIIGDSETNTIPWFIKEDLQNFKRVTLGKTVVMGSKTYLSLGRKLPNRRNVVITRGKTEYAYEPDEKYSSLAEVIRSEESGLFVIGGEHIFGEALRLGPKSMYLTIVKMVAEGDVRFPVDGSRLLYDRIVTSSGSQYSLEHRSEWMIEMGIEFQFTKWNIINVAAR